MPRIGAGNWFSVNQRRFIFGYFFLRFPLSLSIAETVFDFSGKLISFDITGLPSAILPFKNVFSFCHFNLLLFFEVLVMIRILPTDIETFQTAHLTAINRQSDASSAKNRFKFMGS